MSRFFYPIHLFVLGGALGLAGCATKQPPKDLTTARSTYDRASKGPAATFNPADVHAAKVELDMAEASFADQGDTQETRDHAYVATRKAELAESVARTRQSAQKTNQVVSSMHAEEKKVVALTAAELDRTKAQVTAQNAALKAQNVAIVVQGDQLRDEKARREDAEKRAARAAADLARFATVKQEARGMVITLSGSVLFTSAKWDLLPAAQLKLNEVADALTKEDPASKMVVEGHTDSQGSAPYNQDLSQHRAQAVRDYLVTRGIAADRITAQGFGSMRAIGDNKSSEGRANNRRVEIVVQGTPAP
jgi:outer membrane protein OmpA-like peptidoglycan-associated protein